MDYNAILATNKDIYAALIVSIMRSVLMLIA